MALSKTWEWMNDELTENMILLVEMQPALN